MADGLLNKASIILTPTGYKAGTLYNVAPVVEPYEDFDFARASVASRVNSSGLVEMVGRTLSSELVVNGDFSNGTTDWTNASSDTFEVVDGGVGHSTSLHIEVSAINRGAYQSAFVADKTYYVSLDLKVVSGSVYVGKNTRKLNNQNYDNSDWQTITGYLIAVDDKIRIYGNEASEYYVDNVSVKEIIDTNNIPRISYDSNGDNGHILLEPTSTNLLPYSEDFSEWTSKINIEVTLNNTTSPEGVVNAAFINEDNDNAQHFIGTSTSFTSGQDVSVSVFAKKNQRDVLQISPSGNYLNTSGYANYDLTNGLVTASGGGVTAEIEALSNGWYRCIAKFTATTTATGTLALFLQDSTTASRGGSYDGDGSSGLYLWGAQAEALSYATSYIPTLTGSTVTRATETATGAGSATLINSTEGVLYVEALMQDTGTFKTAARITATDTSTTDGMWIYFKSDNKIQSVLRVGGVDQTGIQSSVKTTNQYYKVAFKFKQNDFALWIDGIEVATDLSGNTFSADTLSKVGFVLGTNTNPFYGKVKALAVFNEALSDDELNNLTG